VKKSRPEEHQILAHFWALNDQVVYKPFLRLRNTHYDIPTTIRDHIEYLNHIIHKALELFSEIVANMFWFKRQMQPLYTRMMSDHDLAREALEFNMLKENIERQAAPAYCSALSTMPAQDLPDFAGGGATVGRSGPRVGPMEQGLEKEYLGLKENVGFRRLGDSAGSP
jgi:hypothetical protein